MFPLLFLFCFFITPAKADGYPTVECAHISMSYSHKELKDYWKDFGVPNFILSVKNGVDIYKINYWTTDLSGAAVSASGTFILPTNYAAKSLPLLSYNHGTVVKRNEVPSTFSKELSIGLAFASDGYAVIIPDYIGLGESPGLHPYLHKESQARATIDFILAMKKYARENNIPLNDQLFITGYSQGGHAAMSTIQMLEEKYANQLPITASAPMSGPYSLSYLLESFAQQAPERENLFFLPYMMLAYQEAYNMYPSLEDIFVSPYDSLIPILFDGRLSSNKINRKLPDSHLDLVKKELIEDFISNPDNPFRKALRTNDTHDWKPVTPMNICYCKADEKVPYKVAILTYKRMKELGAKDIRLTHSGKKLNHITCALYSLIYTKYWFDNYRDQKHEGRRGPMVKRMLIDVSKLVAVKKQNQKLKEYKRKEREN